MDAVLNQKNGQSPFPVQLPQQLEKIPGPLGIHLAHRLVEQKQLRIRHQDRRQGKALPLPARQGVDTARPQTPETDADQGFFYPPGDDFFRQSPVFQREGHLIVDGHGEKLVIRRLVDRSDEKPDLFRGPADNVLPIQADFPFQEAPPIRAKDAADRLEQRGFSRPAFPGQQDHLPGAQGKGYIPQGRLLPRAIAVSQVGNTQEFIHSHSPVICRSFRPVPYPSQAPTLLYRKPLTSM